MECLWNPDNFDVKAGVCCRFSCSWWCCCICRCDEIRENSIEKDIRRLISPHWFSLNRENFKYSRLYKYWILIPLYDEYSDFLRIHSDSEKLARCFLIFLFSTKNQLFTFKYLFYRGIFQKDIEDPWACYW